MPMPHIQEHLPCPPQSVSTNLADFQCAVSPTLAELTMADLRSYFLEATNHRPTEQMLDALGAAAKVLERMAEGDCSQSYFLSSLDPGVGKTSMIKMFIKSLVASPNHSDVGVLICVARLAEIKTLVQEMNLLNEDYAVFTANTEMNTRGLGKDCSGAARVLFTTQQMVESRSESCSSFGDLAEFRHNGKPRAVKIWDESLLPGQPIILGKPDVLKLAGGLLKAGFVELAGRAEDLSQSIRGTTNGSKVTVPDLSEFLHDEDRFETILDALEGKTEEIRAVKALRILSGRLTTLSNDGNGRYTVLTYRECLPPDFAPALILDASGRVRETYTMWNRSPRGNLERLPEAPKRYSNLTAHVWTTSGAKSTFRAPKRRDEMVDGIASLISTKPNDKWLVIHHKAEASFDIAKSVTALLPENLHSNVSFLPWGSHKATNDFVAVPNIILAGTLFLPSSQYEALGRLSLATPDRDRLDKDSYNALVLGEHMDQILQAACRGSIRQSRDGDCPPSNLYVIASKKSGIRDVLRHVFPGCKLKPWKAVPSVLKGKVKDATEFIKEELGQNSEQLLWFKSVMEAIGMKDTKNFRSRVRKNLEFIAEMEAAGIVEVSEGRGRSGFKTVEDAYGFSPTTNSQAV